MKGLTLRHPWAFAIAHWGKRIENRTWKPPKALIGQRIAIHGGKVPTAHEALADIKYIFDPAFADPWFDIEVDGNVGWVLRDVIVLPTPIPCKGAQGLWDVPDSIAKVLQP